MPGSGTPHVLIVYSNPDEAARLRLDREHRAIDKVLERHRIDPRFVRRIHAATVHDFARALRDEDYEIVHFSGHGSSQGIVLDKEGAESGLLVGPRQVAAMLRESLPRLHAAIFMSCFSADQIDDLKDAATFIMTVRGEAGDDAAIDFVAHMYDGFYSFGSIEPAFRGAVAAIDAAGHGRDLKPVLVRRVSDKDEQRLLVHVLFSRRPHAVVIDLAPAERDIASLGVSRGDFLELLAHKMNLHKFVFSLPREKALLSIGRFVGEFSWRDARDIVVCHRVVRLREGLESEAYDVWGDLLVKYNDLCTERYRGVAAPTDPLNDRIVQQALKAHWESFQYFFEEGPVADTLRRHVPEQFLASRTTIGANLRLADAKITGDVSKAVAGIEIALSSLHDLVREMTEAFRVREDVEST